MRVNLIAITKVHPDQWQDSMKVGWNEIHYIPAPVLKNEDNCCIAEEIAYKLQDTIENTWYDMEEDVWLRMYIQCPAPIFMYIAKWYNKKHFVFPVFKDKIFIGWRIYEVPQWARSLMKNNPDMSQILFSDSVLHGGLTRERQGVEKK